MRDIQLYLNDELKYEGPIRMGRGQVDQDYSQFIPLDSSSETNRQLQMVAVEEAAVKSEAAADALMLQKPVERGGS